MSIWTREVKSIAAFSVHDILSGMYLGLLHKIENVCKHAKETVFLFQNEDYKYPLEKGRREEKRREKVLRLLLLSTLLKMMLKNCCTFRR